jgi:GR25 family glycosyltransferase involved in LPS biosynthesis
MKSFIIRLSNFQNSSEWAEVAYKSAKKYNWDVDFFEGIDGRNSTLEEYGLKINPNHRKSKKAFKRVGTVGCLLSHYSLWLKCIELNEPICILEHDVTVHAPFPKIEFKDVYKFCIGPKAKNIYIGEWWASGAGYCVSVEGAKKLVSFAKTEGVMPADTMLCNGIVDLAFSETDIVTFHTHEFSFTWDLKDD